MFIKKYLKFFFITSFIIVSLIILSKIFQEKKIIKENNANEKNIIIESDSNLIKNVSYKAKDARGNEYLINAKEGKTNQIDKGIIFLKNVDAKIILNDGFHINIYSEYAEYNILNYNTIFKQNVMLDYIDNKIIGNYLELSLEKNLILMKENLIFKNSDSMLKADAIEINTISKDSKIFMYSDEKKINIKKFN